MQDIYILRFLKLIIVLLGMVLIYLAVKGYRKTRRKDLVFLALGFALITAGSVAAGILFEFLGFQLVDVEIVESAMIVLGFASLIYSIFGFD
ncbi:MAG: hypothetical protein ABSD99_00675 [Candidatus Bathyarchaeia archaeon]|jgi:hypothetical protein